MTRPRCSVIVPAKDQADFLADCLKSLCSQFSDPDDLEVILIDDGSLDATAEIAWSFADRLPRLTVLRNDVPVGLASARNLGLSEATGEFIGYLDADDWLAPRHLPHLCDETERLGVDFVRTDHVQSTAGRRVQVWAPEARRNRVLDPRDSILPASVTTMVDYCYAWAGVFNRRIAHLLPFPDGLFTAEDRSWSWRLHLEAASYAVVASPGLIYRRGLSTSLTQVVDRRQLDFIPAFRLVFDLVAADREAERFWPKAARMFLGVLAYQLRRQDKMDETVRDELVTRAREVLTVIPVDVLAGALPGLDVKRQQVVAPVLFEPDSSPKDPPLPRPRLRAAVRYFAGGQAALSPRERHPG